MFARHTIHHLRPIDRQAKVIITCTVNFHTAIELPTPTDGDLAIFTTSKTFQADKSQILIPTQLNFFLTAIKKL